jgi:hypothetical protein
MLRLEGVYGLYVLIPMIVSPFLFFDVFKRLQELLAILVAKAVDFLCQRSVLT